MRITRDEKNSENSLGSSVDFVFFRFYFVVVYLGSPLFLQSFAAIFCHQFLFVRHFYK